MRSLRADPWLILVTVAAAISLLFFVNVEWWHPYCDNQAFGPGSFGKGFPLPYEEAGPNSMETDLLLPVYLLSLAIVALPIFAVFRTVWGWGIQIRLLLSGIFGIVAASAMWFVFAVQASPQLEFRFVDGDPVTSFRPASTVDWSHHRSCDRW